MKIHPIVEHLNSIVTVTLQTSYVGDGTDTTDKQRITSYGDPRINLAGTFQEPLGGPTTFTFPVADYYKGLTTEMANYPVRFMTQLPVALPGQPATVQGPLDCIVSDPVKAAEVWVTVMESTRIPNALTTLRAKTPAALTTLPDATVQELVYAV